MNGHATLEVFGPVQLTELTFLPPFGVLVVHLEGAFGGNGDIGDGAALLLIHLGIFLARTRRGI